MYFDNDNLHGPQDFMDEPSETLPEMTLTHVPQVAIEQKMAETVAAGIYEAAHLFSDEGLPIAQAASAKSQNVERDRIAEMAILFQDVRRMASLMGGISSLREVTIEGENRRKIVFRFFRAFEQQVILAVVVPPNKAYRQRTNELEKLIVGVSG
jgi:predicted regulator of Ras-like GTPase activity (Roadblock/LC7/MglB family)